MTRQNIESLTISELEQIIPQIPYATTRIYKSFDGKTAKRAMHWGEMEEEKRLFIQDFMMRQARGCYQRALLNGDARWSGSDLQGRAARYGSKYAASRKGLLERINRNILKPAPTPVFFAFSALVYNASSKRWTRELLLNVGDTSTGAFKIKTYIWSV